MINSIRQQFTDQALFNPGVKRQIAGDPGRKPSVWSCSIGTRDADVLLAQLDRLLPVMRVRHRPCRSGNRCPISGLASFRDLQGAFWAQCCRI